MSESYEAGRRLLKSNWTLIDDPWKSDQSLGVPAPAQEEGPKEGEAVLPLIPASEFKPRGGSLLELLRTRKSRRKYTPEALTREEFSFLCWAAAGIKDHRPKFSFRTYPSGGARHPFDLFAFVARVEGIDPGLYRYLPVEHALARVRAGDDSRALGEALCGQDWNPAAVFVWAAVPYRTEWRYGPVSHKIVALDAGHACQNLYLACEAIGAGTCAIGAYDQDKLDAYLGVDGKDRFALYAAPVGRPPAESL
ncbi:MAG: SagB/ThcOx family dehydrogenase [Treponema sp.]|nr:SagB/ThcOx family dehydrogenase [Treponema sp.]